MIKKDTLTWVDGISEFKYHESPTIINFKGNDDVYFGSSDLLSDELFNSFFSQLNKSRKYEFTDEEKMTYASLIADFIFNNDFDTFISAMDVEWNNDSNISALEPKNNSLQLLYLPIQESIKNQYTGRIESKDLHVFGINRAAWRLIQGDQVVKFDAHCTLGAYCESANVILVDLTMLDDSRCLTHELLHAVIASLRTYLDDAMYDTAENKREEICVHFMTDGYERLNFIHSNFDMYKFERDASEITGDDPIEFIVGSKKFKTITTSMKKSFSATTKYFGNCTYATTSNIMQSHTLKLASHASERGGITSAMAEKRASFNSFGFSEALNNLFQQSLNKVVSRKRYWRLRK